MSLTKQIIQLIAVTPVSITILITSSPDFIITIPITLINLMSRISFMSSCQESKEEANASAPFELSGLNIAVAAGRRGSHLLRAAASVTRESHFIYDNGIRAEDSEMKGS